MSQTQFKAHVPIPDGIPDYPEDKPRLDPKLVKAFVTAAHANLDAVKVMLEAEPELLNAAWDWGNGDWETALESAGHMGNQAIASYLISKGARLNLFCAAMLGNLDFVKASFAMHPDVKHSKGPHGLSLMHHAKAGGTGSEAVVKYLESVGLA